ncbi:Maintenance of telomere capping protein 4 [Candida viswanathii]|uniref:Maintenance of telomere capping protein 4 n=1 Tax=Candida viswanathii TaxID=5486 RepID=A0A367XPY6_9ASCO|nr:Maintenance of telomere capping protein 4 [Candida viswanathii]
MSREGSITSPKNLSKKKRVVSSQLRLSQIDQEAQEDSRASSPTSPHVKTELPEFPPHKRPQNKPIIHTLPPKTYNDFDIDTNSLDTMTTQVPSLFNQTTEPHNKATHHTHEHHHDITKEELKKASELTSIFLDTRKLLSVERNVVDPTSDTPEKFEQDSLSNIKISRGTLIRAEKVKTTLAVKYLYIQRTYEWSENHKETNEHPGVEGVYNPIQIIRNRKIRNKYNEHPQPLIHMKTIPLACNVFSLHNAETRYDASSGHKKKNWKMMWAIDLNEFVGDPRWRINHWNELKDPHGNLWFPDPTQDEERHSPAQSATSSRKKIFTLRSKHGDKLTDEELSQFDSHDDDEFRGIKLRNQNRKLSHEAGSSSDTELHNFKITRSKSPKRHKIKNKMKKFYNSGAGSANGGGDSSSSSNAINEFGTTEEKLAYAEKQAAIERQATAESDPLSKQFFKRLTPPTHDDSDSPPLELSVPQIRVEPTSPSIKTDNDWMLDINLKQTVLEVEFLPSDKRGNGDLHVRTHSSSDGGASGSAITGDEGYDDERAENDNDADAEARRAECNAIFDEREATFRNIVGNLDYFQQYLNLRSQYLLTTYPNYLEVVDKTAKEITHYSIYEILSTISKINDDYIPGYEDLYSGFMEEIKSVIHMVNDVYSVKIDTLLSTSDRSISEINASLSLDLRKITEKLDYLDQSINTNVFHSTLLKKKRVSNVGWIYKFLYSCLENAIIVLLRSIWIVVNIYKAIKYVFVAIWKFIKFIFW